jgi:HD superfamily phosphodiesterase
MQGFAIGLGLTEKIVSPSYALLQEYGDGALTHIDLYRLNEKQAKELISHLDDHSGIIAIEWPEKHNSPLDHDLSITLDVINEKERSVHVIFADAPIPSPALIDEWRAEVLLPEHIIHHCERVADSAETISNHCENRGMIVRKQAVIAAAKLHDLLRFVDFHHNGNPEKNVQVTEKQQQKWQELQALYPAPHEEAVANFLKEKGYSLIGEIVRTHRGYHSPARTYSLEQMIVAYADKRVIENKIVSIDERFEDLDRRYRSGIKTTESIAWKAAIKQMEEILDAKELTF